MTYGGTTIRILDGNFMVIKWAMDQKDIKILNMQISNNKASEFLKKKWEKKAKQKKQTNSNHNVRF